MTSSVTTTVINNLTIAFNKVALASNTKESNKVSPTINSGAVFTITDSANNIVASLPKLLQLNGQANVTVVDNVKAINANLKQLLSLGSELKSLVLPDGTTINILGNDGTSLTLNAQDAVNLVKEGLQAPIHVLDNSNNMNLDALAQISQQLLIIQDTNSSFKGSIDLANLVLPGVINVSDSLVLAPKLLNTQGSPENFSIMDNANIILTNMSALVQLSNQIDGVIILDSVNNIVNNLAALKAAAVYPLVIVADSAQDINANLKQLLSLGNELKGFSLPDGTLIDVLATDGTSVTVDAANALNLFREGLSIPMHVVFNDNTGSAQSLQALATLGSQLLSVQYEGYTFSGYQVTVLNALAPNSSLLPSSGTPITNINDSATNIAGNSNGIQAKVANVTVTDSVKAINANWSKLLSLGSELQTLHLTDGTIIPVLSADGASVTLDAHDALNFAKKGLTASIHAILTNYDSHTLDGLAKLGTQLLSVQFENNLANVNFSVANALALLPKISLSFSGNTDSVVNIVDSAKNIANNAPALQKIASELTLIGSVEAITVTDNPHAINANWTQLLSLGNELKTFVLPDGTTISVQGNDGHSITLTVNDALNFKKEGFIVPVRIVDYANNIISNADALAQLGKQLLSIQDISNNNNASYNLNVADTLALASKLITSQGNKASFIINDSVQAINNANLAKLLSLGSNLKGILLSDGSTITVLRIDNKALYLNVSDAIHAVKEGLNLPLRVLDYGENIAANSHLLASMGTQLLSIEDHFAVTFPYAINVADTLALAPKFINVQSKPEIFSNVADSAQNIFTNLDKLQSLSAQITGISLTDSSKPTVTITAGQFNTDSQIMATINGAYNMIVTGVTTGNLNTVLANSHVSSVSLADTGAHINANLNNLQTHSAQISSITLTDSTPPTLAISATQLSNDSSLLALISSGYYLTVSGVSVANLSMVLANPHVVSVVLSDTAAHINSNLDSLESHITQISGINLTGGGVPSLSLTADQLTNDAQVLAAINGSYNLLVSGINTSNINTVLANSHVSTVSLTDSGANIVTNLDSLQSHAAQITSISLNDITPPTLAISATQYSNDNWILNLITGNYYLMVSGVSVAALNMVLSNPHVATVTLSDTAANINVALDNLQAHAAQITGITLTDSSKPTLAITANQLSNDSGVLGLISGNYYLTVSGVSVANLNNLLSNPHVASVTLSDTAANINAALDNLQAHAAQIIGISLTDSSKPTLAITANQLSNDSSVLGLISGNYYLTVSGVSVANLNSLLSNPHVASVTLSDTAANINAALDNLQAHAAQIIGISLTDSSTPTLAITANQLSNDSSVLGLISGNYYLTVSGVSVANLNSLLSNPHVASVTLSDTAANINAALDNLQAHATQITGISLTDGSVPSLALTDAQFKSDAQLLALIGSSYNLVVKGVNTGDINTVLANSHVNAVTVLDSAANITANLDSLENNASNIVSITLTDLTTPTLTLNSAQLVSDAAILAKISGNYNISLLDSVTTNSLTSAISNNHLITPFKFADNSANVFSALDTIEANLNKISAIKLTDATLPTVSLKASQYVTDAPALAVINALNNYQLTLTGEKVANITKDFTDNHVVQLSLSDTSAHILASLDSLQAQLSKLGTISFTDAGTPTLNLTVSKFYQDSGVLAQINTPYNLNLSNETIANVATDVANSHVKSVAIIDSAANLQANLDSLSGNALKISSITLTDGSTPTFNLNVAQYLNDSALFTKLTTPYHVTITDTAAHVATNLAALESQLTLAPTGIVFTDSTTPTLTLTSAQIKADAFALTEIQSPYLLSVQDTGATINGLNLFSAEIELKPTTLSSYMSAGNVTVYDLNLSLINLTGDTINEKVYGTNGTEIDVLNSKGVVISQMIFAHDTEAQLQLVGVNPAIVHII